MQESEMTTTPSSQGRLPSVPHLPDTARRAGERRRVQRKEGRKVARAQRKVHGHSEIICVSLALSSLVSAAFSSGETSATAEWSILPVNKMPLLGLTPACPYAPVDYFCIRAPAMLSSLTAPPRAPNDVMVKVLSDCNATVENQCDC